VDIKKIILKLTSTQRSHPCPQHDPSTGSLMFRVMLCFCVHEALCTQQRRYTRIYSPGFSRRPNRSASAFLVMLSDRHVQLYWASTAFQNGILVPGCLCHSPNGVHVETKHIRHANDLGDGGCETLARSACSPVWKRYHIITH
jgi:hypothetical protein